MLTLSGSQSMNLVKVNIHRTSEEDVLILWSCGCLDRIGSKRRLRMQRKLCRVEKAIEYATKSFVGCVFETAVDYTERKRFFCRSGYGFYIETII